MIWTSHSDIALTMPVPLRTPVRTAAAMTMLTTATIDGAWAISWAPWSLTLGKLTSRAMAEPTMKTNGSGMMLATSVTMTATVRPRLNQNSLGRRVVRLGSRAVSAMAESRSSTSASVRSSTATEDPSGASCRRASPPEPLRPRRFRNRGRCCRRLHRRPCRRRTLQLNPATPQISGAVAAEAVAFLQAEQPGEDQHHDESGDEGRDHGHEDIVDVELQRGGGAGGGAAPGQDVHGAVGQAGHAGQDHGAHLEPQVDRQHGRGGEDEGGGAVAVERDSRREDGRAEDHLGGVVAELAQDEPDQGVEEPDVDHQAEVDDGEHQQRGRGRHGLHGVQHHGADAEARAGEKSEDCGDDDQRQHGRQLLGHDQHHEYRDHGES